MSEVRVVGLAKRYSDVWALRDATFEASAGSFVTLLGPSGCGKTTTLRLIAGFEPPDDGDILLGGSRINDVPPWKRGLGVVFQSYALFPFMTVFDNVAFGLRRRGIAEIELRRKVAATLELVDLPHLDGRYPRQLSGGQQQRVALARALVIEPTVLLLDEPLSNLDAKLRAEMRFELKRIQRDSGVTTILVTHDQDEAMTLSDHIVVMNKGRVLLAGTPRTVWGQPGRRFVAEFFGVENLLAGRCAETGVFKLDGVGHTLRIRSDLASPGSQHRILGIRAADVEVLGAPAPGAAGELVSGIVREAVYRGSFFTCQVITDLAAKPIVAETSMEVARGDSVWLRLRGERQMMLEDDPPEAA